MVLRAERLLPSAAAVGTSAIVALATGHVSSAHAPVLGLTVRRPVAAGARVPAGDLAVGPIASSGPPSARGPLFARVTLTPGEPVSAAELTTKAPQGAPALPAGDVVQTVTLATSALPAGTGRASVVALVGAANTSQAVALLATRALVLAAVTAPTVLGAAPSRELTIALPLASALAVAAAERNGSLALLAWPTRGQGFGR